MQNSFKKHIEKLIEEYFPDDKTAAESLLRVFSGGVQKELKRYSNSTYRAYIMKGAKDDRILGQSEGADKCVELIQKMLD